MGVSKRHSGDAPVDSLSIAHSGDGQARKSATVKSATRLSGTSLVESPSLTSCNAGGRIDAGCCQSSLDTRHQHFATVRSLTQRLHVKIV